VLSYGAAFQFEEGKAIRWAAYFNDRQNRIGPEQFGVRNHPAICLTEIEARCPFTFQAICICLAGGANMKKHLLILIPVVVAISFTACRKNEASNKSQPPETEPASPAQVSTSDGGIAAAPPFAGGRKTSFQEVTSQLDPGGSFFLYLATDRWLAGLSTNIAELQQALSPLAGPNRDDVEKALGVLTGLVRNSGLENVTGVGISGAPVAPGLFRNKFVVHRRSGDGQGFLWSMFGAAPHALAGQSMLPTNTALAAFGDLDPKPLWQAVEQTLGQSGIPDAQEAIRNWPKIFEKQTQIPWAQLLGSLAGEAGVLLTLDASQTVELPLGGQVRAVIPLPGLLVAVKINDSLLYDHFSAQLRANPKATTSEEGGLKVCSVALPAPFPVELTVASTGEYLYLASSVQLVRTVEEIRQGKQPGLKSWPAFADLAKHLPAQGNQFVYVGQAFGQTFTELQRQLMTGTGAPVEQLEVVQRLFGDPASSFSLSIGGHTATGWQTTSVGNKDSASAAVLAPAVGVTAIAAGMLLPALAKAKAKAQTINTVSNLKQLGLAARMYSNENQEKFPKAETWSDDLKSYLGNTKVYKAVNDPSQRRCSFAFNAKLSGLSETKINPQTVLFFETDEGDWNQSGGPELLIGRPRSGDAYVFGFADGSVQMIQRSRLSSLRWDP
jgi:hypothetical protein